LEKYILKRDKETRASERKKVAEEIFRNIEAMGFVHEITMDDDGTLLNIQAIDFKLFRVIKEKFLKPKSEG